MNPKIVYNSMAGLPIDAPDIFMKVNSAHSELYKDCIVYSRGIYELMRTARNYVHARGINPDHAAVYGRHLLVLDSPNNREIIGKAWALDVAGWLRISLCTAFGREWKKADIPDWTPTMHRYLDSALACFILNDEIYIHFSLNDSLQGMENFAEFISGDKYWIAVSEATIGDSWKVIV